MAEKKTFSNGGVAIMNIRIHVPAVYARARGVPGMSDRCSAVRVLGRV